MEEQVTTPRVEYLAGTTGEWARVKDPGIITSGLLPHYIMRAVAYPNHTGVPNGSLLVIRSVDGKYVNTTLVDESGEPQREVKMANFCWENDWIEHVGVDIRFENNNYINKMASAMGVLTTPDMYVALRGKSKREINLYLLQKSEEKPEVTIPPEVALAVRNVVVTRTNEEVRRLEHAIADEQVNLRSYVSAAERCTIVISDKRRELERVRNTNTYEEKIVEQVSNVLKEGWYTYGGHGLTFITPNITLTHGDVSVNMGRYKVSLSGNEGIWPRIFTHEDNLHSGAYIHPHFGEHTYCWGNALDSLTRAVENMDVVKILNLVRAYISTYNHDSPYVSIHHWSKLRAANGDTNSLPKVAYMFSSYYYVLKSDTLNPLVCEDLLETDELYIKDGADREEVETSDVVRISIYNKYVDGENTGEYARASDGRYISLDLSEEEMVITEDAWEDAYGNDDDDDDEYYDEDEE